MGKPIIIQTAKQSGFKDWLQTTGMLGNGFSQRNRGLLR
jgi:hypothetical protein